jgi:cysteine-rich repeat protein
MARSRVQERIRFCVGMLLGAVACGSGCAGAGDQGGDAECVAATDCAVEWPGCRAATACDAGQCVFENAAEGTSLPDPMPGDCQALVCDGQGAAKLVPSAMDVEDDGRACTADICVGSTPIHELLSFAHCYTGPADTKGVGVCKPGFQLCDAEGMTVGECAGQTLPGEESCLSPLDDDCDGEANEEGFGCACVPGTLTPCYTGPAATMGVGACHAGMAACKADGLGFGSCAGDVKPGVEACDVLAMDEDCDGQVNEEGASCACGDGFVSAGEECDDGNQSGTDACTPLCKAPACGDGYVQPASGEQCDDGNPDATDGCTPACEPPACGDGFLQSALGEQCDDGNASDADRCTTSCSAQGVMSVAAGGYHDCALRSDGSVKCWGYNESGRLGLGDVNHRGDTPGEMGDDLSIVSLGTGKMAQAVAAGNAHSCALLSDGNVKCWGFNAKGELGLGDMNARGDGSSEMGDSLPIVSLGMGRVALALSSYYRHTCALLDDASIKCWGDNDYGQLGLGDTNARGDGPEEMGDSLPPVDLGADAIAVALTSGKYHSCALFNDGSMKCWGYNYSGQLGLGNTTNHGAAPGQMGDNLLTVSFATGKKVQAITAGNAHSCALLTDGNVKCWGYNAYGQLGLGTISNRGDGPGEMGDNLPSVDLGTGKTAVAIAAGQYHTCALLNDGSVKCWGYNVYGQLGVGGTSHRGDGPGEMGDNLPVVDLGVGKTALAIEAGLDHTCALLNDGSVKCWGYNVYGQLGLGDTFPRGGLPTDMGDALLSVKLFSAAW